MLPTPPLLLITDRTQARLPLVDVVAAAVAGGCRWVSLREKDLCPAGRLALLAELRAVTGPAGAQLTVHGDLDAARACDGVHLGAGGDVTAARDLLGPGALVGVSCHTVDAVRRAAAAGADYVTLSPIFLTDSKPGYGPALGPGALRGAAAIGVPVLALGGVGVATAAACREAGAAGLAVMGGVMRAAEPAGLVRRLLGAWCP
ncbi:thiamine phosphate synthase [Aerophototrophica crusticola]|uniref:Thiamine phosphate synthase n=1 Tax=Aerophototrophica crusticola TaxID=1709002 RepID=A0A858R9W3_9PROT|nr:thiamine phosphate synthase [Rhodospirillaceae bacterium B3]